MKYYVFFSDYYKLDDEGGCGWECFKERIDAEKFIDARISKLEGRTINDYAVILGNDVPLSIAEIIKKVKVG